MTDYAKYPFVRMLIPFALGVWCCVCISSFRLTPIVTIGIALALFAMAAVTAFVLKSYRHNWVFGAVMACYLVLAGYALTQVHQAETQKDYYRNYEADAKYYVARVYDYPTERPNSIRTVLDLEYQFGDSLPSRPVSGKVMAYFPKSDSAFALRYGDLIAIPAPVRAVTPPLNPGEFDYKAYLERKGITGQIYLKDEDWLDLQTNNANPIYAFSYRFRDILLASLQRSGLSDDEYGVAAAILLGYDDNLADEVRKNYVAAGSMHILCVSGMHVGIIYLLASFLLGFLNRKKWQKVLKQVLLLTLIWFYALIAGLSPSILRASLMLTFVIVGEMIGRKGFIINSIAASAFVLLCVNPNNLLEIGFLLSYAAVLGIVLVSWVPYLSTLVGYLVWGAVYVMNWVVAKIESFPGSIVKGLYISDLEFALLLVALLLLLLRVVLQKRQLFIAFLGTLLLVMVSVTVRMYSSEHQQGMMVYSLRNHTAVDFVRGGEHLLLADSTLMADASTVDYSLKGAWAQRHLSYHPQVVGLEEDFTNSYLCKKSNLVSFDGKLLALWDDALQCKDSLDYRLPIDYLLVRGKQKPDVQSAVNGYDAQLLLIDGSVPRYLAEKWRTQAEALDMPCYNLAEGALEVGLR